MKWILIGCVLFLMSCTNSDMDTVRTLYLVRHAKSSNAPRYKVDFERPLQKEGKQQAKYLGKYLEKRGVKVEKFYASAAKRTRSTAKRIARKIDLTWKDVVEDSMLYKASIPTYLDYLRKLPDSLYQIAVVGHNPATLGAINYFQLDTVMKDLPVGSIVGIQFKLDSWQSLSSKSGTFLFFVPPAAYLSDTLSIEVHELDSIEATITEEELKEEVIDLMKVKQ